MKYEIDYLPRFRESEADGLVSLKGYMNYFQDIAAGQYHSMGKGNNNIPQKYGLSWVYSRYKLKIYAKTGFDHMINIATWISKLDPVRSWQEMEIRRGEELLCEGRLESCVVDLRSNRIGRITDIELPEGLLDERFTSVGPFSRRLKKPDGAEYRYTHKVRYTDLDLSRHMNNLHYVDMFMNAFDPDFYDRYFVTDFEIQYIHQAYFDEELDIFLTRDENSYVLYAVNNAKALVAECMITVREHG